MKKILAIILLTIPALSTVSAQQSSSVQSKAQSRLKVTETKMTNTAPFLFLVKISTRFGELATSDQSYLTFNGNLISPRVSLTSTAYLNSTFRLPDADVVLIQLDGGNSCPGKFNFVSVTKDGVTVSPDFGTCYDDEIHPLQSNDTITFKMHSPGARSLVTYQYKGGEVYENGKKITKREGVTETVVAQSSDANGIVYFDKVVKKFFSTHPESKCKSSGGDVIKVMGVSFSPDEKGGVNMILNVVDPSASSPVLAPNPVLGPFKSSPSSQQTDKLVGRKFCYSYSD